MKTVRLSYSSWDTYLHCPYKYVLKHVQYVKPDVDIRYPLITGVAFHNLVNYMYSVQNFDKKFLTQNWKRFFMDELRREGSLFASTEGYEKYLSYGYGLINKFYQFAAKEGYLIKPISTEWDFKVPSNGQEIVGKVDLIIQREGKDFVEVLDFKTSWKLPPEDFIDKSMQLTMYHWAVYNLLNIKNSVVALFYPRKDKVLYGKRTEADHQKMMDGITEFGTNVKNGRFEPNLGHCPDCEFKESCKFYKK